MTASTKSKVPKRIASEIRAFCEAHADPVRVQKYSRYFVEGYDSFGVDHKLPEWEARRADWFAQLTAAGLPALLDTCDLLVRPGKYEEVVTAIRFVADSSALYSPEVFARIGKWFQEGIANWAEVDVMCGLVLGHFLKRGVVGIAAFQPWAASPFKYQRRAVPVTLIELLRATKDFPAVWRTIEPLIEPLMSDKEKVVQQGMGWFLREVWKRQPQLAEAFLLRHKDTCPRLIVQYATEKMDSAGKLRFKRSR
jgi:3-methyladenine DNA glycosylase AlkD